MSKNKILFIILILMLGACNAQPTTLPTSTELSAALSELQGTVGIKKPEEQAFKPAIDGSFLEQNGQVETGEDGRVRLDLSSGTIIRLAPASRFTLVSNEVVDEGLATRLKLELGRLFIVLNGGSIEVETPSGVASVRGSQMIVEIDPETGDIRIYCLEGHCSAINPAGSLDFTAGQKAVLLHRDPVTGKYTAPEVGIMTPEDFEKWLDEYSELKNLFQSVEATVTALAPTPEPTSIPVPTQVSSNPPQNSTKACFSLVEPLSDASLPFQGPVNFEWEAQPGAKTYVVTFSYPGGLQVSFETTDTNMERYIETMPDAGDYSWGVTAFSDSGAELCTTEAASFSKPDSFPEPEPLYKQDEPSPTDAPTDVPACDPCDQAGNCYNPDTYFQYFNCYTPPK